METHSRFTGIVRFAKVVTLLDLGILSVLAVIVWLAGWTLYQYGESLVLVGAGAALVGLSSVMANLNLTSDISYRYGQSVSEQSLAERTQQNMKDTARSNSFLSLMLTAGLIAVLIGSFVQFAAR